MFKDTHAFSGFSVNDLDAAKTFYGDTLGLDVDGGDMGLKLKLAGGGEVFVYNKPNHEAASFTILNFRVDDIDKAVADLKAKGVMMEHYEPTGDMPAMDENDIIHSDSPEHGPSIAWFKDPAGNVLSVLQDLS